MLAVLLKRTLALVMAFIMTFAGQSATGGIKVKTTDNSSAYLELSSKTGNKYIAQIVRYNAETFCPTTADDYSNPYYNNLPRGTVDYCNPQKVTDPESGKKYYVLASGMRVYAKSRDVKVYKGTP